MKEAIDKADELFDDYKDILTKTIEENSPTNVILRLEEIKTRIEAEMLEKSSHLNRVNNMISSLHEFHKTFNIDHLRNILYGDK